MGNILVRNIADATKASLRRGTLSRADALTALQISLRPFQELVATENLHNQALSLAIDLRHPVYDCFYLALAQRENAPLVTADEAMIAAARKAKIKVRRI